jgi:putative ABC transport system ATP-binding protein
MSLVRLEGVSKQYPMGDGLVQALRGVDFAVEQGELVALWGPSGSGKSTLCHLLGLIDSCDGGRLWFNGVAGESLGEAARSDLRSRHIGFIFQSFNLFPVLTAVENVMFPLQLRGIPGAMARSRAAALLETLGLGAQLDRRPDRLSGGQRQRVAIARALVGDPLLVIADEPTANLDSVTAREIIDLMRDLNRQRGATFVFATHDQRLLDRVGRRVQLRDGVIVEDCRDRAGD